MVQSSGESASVRRPVEYTESLFVMRLSKLWLLCPHKDGNARYAKSTMCFLFF